MNTYRITNRVNGESLTVTANSAQEACQSCGWLIGDCYVKELRDTPPANQDWQHTNQRVRTRTMGRR